MEKADRSSNVDNGKREWCSYHSSNGYLNKDCHQQQSESANINRKKIWCTYHESGSHSDDECYHQRNSKCSSPADIIMDSNMTACEMCSCNINVKNICTKIDDESNYTPSGIGFSFAMCHPRLSQESDGFQLSVDSGSLKQS